MNTTDTPLLSVPLSLEAHRLAQQFAAEQANPHKGKQVYLNTLAVYAVDCYLQWMEIETNLNQSDCWQSDLRTLLDVADLVLLDIGKLECRPVLPGETFCTLPPEVLEDRIGYVAVKFSEQLDAVQLLGFSPAIATDSPAQLKLSDLEPFENLLDYLTPASAPVSDKSTSPDKTLVNLGQWLQNIFEGSWQSIETLLRPEATELAFGFRSVERFRDSIFSNSQSVTRRGKLVDLGIQIPGHPVALIVAINPESEQKTNVLLQVHPTSSPFNLPSNLQLTVIDESGATFLEGQARNDDNYLQLQFWGCPKERFSVRIAINDVSIVEDFIL